MIYLYFSNNNKPPVKWKTYVYECVCFLGLENAEHNHQMQNIILHFCNFGSRHLHQYKQPLVAGQ